MLELTALRQDRTEFPIEISVAAFRINEQWFAAGIVRDISQRKRAEAALREKNRALRHLMLSSDLERQLIAYEIHDGLAQELAGAMMQFDSYDARKGSDPADAAAAFQAGMSMLRQSHAEARRLIAGVRPPILNERGIVAAIAHLVNELRHSEGLRINFRSSVLFRRLVPPLENGIYRICQAALTNTCKYSKSDRVRVSLRQAGDRMRIEIRDWGIGFKKCRPEGSISDWKASANVRGFWAASAASTAHRQGHARQRGIARSGEGRVSVSKASYASCRVCEARP